MTMTHVQIETLDPATATLTLSLDVGLYPRDVLYAAAYVFLDRAYVLLDRQDSRFIVHFRGKRALEEATFRAMAGEFENELLAQALRHRVVDANQRIIEDVVAVAIAGASAGVEPRRGSRGGASTAHRSEQTRRTASSPIRSASPDHGSRRSKGTE